MPPPPPPPVPPLPPTGGRSSSHEPLRHCWYQQPLAIANAPSVNVMDNNAARLMSPPLVEQTAARVAPMPNAEADERAVFPCRRYAGGVGARSCERWIRASPTETA